MKKDFRDEGIEVLNNKEMAQMLIKWGNLRKLERRILLSVGTIFLCSGL